MKKIAALVLCALLLFTACSGDQSGSENGGQSKQNDGYFFEYKSTVIAVGSSIDEYTDLLGEPKSYYEAESCAFKGLDKTFTYSGFEIYTNPVDGKDVIASILITNDSIQTKEGIFIGSSADDVVKAYGEAQNGIYKYSSADTSISIVIADGKVISIEYL